MTWDLCAELAHFEAAVVFDRPAAIVGPPDALLPQKNRGACVMPDVSIVFLRRPRQGGQRTRQESATGCGQNGGDSGAYVFTPPEGHAVCDFPVADAADSIFKAGNSHADEYELL